MACDKECDRCNVLRDEANHFMVRAINAERQLDELSAHHWWLMEEYARELVSYGKAETTVEGAGAGTATGAEGTEEQGSR